MNNRKTTKLSFEKSVPGRRGADLPALDVLESELSLPESMLSERNPALPELSEIDVVRHYTELSTRQRGVDNLFYPLGSCTMKYNPKMNEDGPGHFAGLHPLADEQDAQGALKLMRELSGMLAEITGMDAVTLQPAAGAQGELTGLMVMKAYHESRGDAGRTKIIVPDSSHGTNPASAAMAGFTIVEIKSAPDGSVDLGALRKAVGEDTAGLMLTNPSTLGMFETNIEQISRIVHEAGGLLYYDGANLNAVMGVVRPGDTGFDVVHLNLHKTFSTPHGGGGPGSGPVGVKEFLMPFLPGPSVEKIGATYRFVESAASIGKVKAFYGNFGVYVKAYAYILSLGASGLKAASQNAVLNANYVMQGIKEYYPVATSGICMHEFVVSADCLAPVSATDVAKALIDKGYHPPTVYFPLIVHEALMIEPTETEGRETLDGFIAAMVDIAKLAGTNPELLANAPQTTPVGRPDQTLAARKPKVRYTRE